MSEAKSLKEQAKTNWEIYLAVEMKNKEIQKLERLLTETLRQAKEYEDKMEGQVAEAQQILNEFPTINECKIEETLNVVAPTWEEVSMKQNEKLYLIQQWLERLQAALSQKEQKTDSEAKPK